MFFFFNFFFFRKSIHTRHRSYIETVFTEVKNSVPLLSPDHVARDPPVPLSGHLHLHVTPYTLWAPITANVLAAASDRRRRRRPRPLGRPVRCDNFHVDDEKDNAGWKRSSSVKVLPREPRGSRPGGGATQLYVESDPGDDRKWIVKDTRGSAAAKACNSNDISVYGAKGLIR